MAWTVVTVPIFSFWCHGILSLQHLHGVQANFRSQPLLFTTGMQSVHDGASHTPCMYSKP